MITMISLIVIVASVVVWFFKEPQNTSKKVTSLKSHYFLQQDIAEERDAERKFKLQQKQLDADLLNLRIQEQKLAIEQRLINKFLSSDRSKKLGLTEDDVVITYVTETVTKNGNTKTFTYPKVVRI